MTTQTLAQPEMRTEPAALSAIHNWMPENPEAALLSSAIDTHAFLENNPEFLGNKIAVVDMAYEEYCRKRAAGIPVNPDQFVEQFPVFQNSIRRTIITHELLARYPELLDIAEPVRWPACDEEYLGFRLLEVLGKGGVSRVYLAAEIALGNRIVVVKLAKRGDHEAKNQGPLTHPNIVQVHSVKEDQKLDLSVICMPYLGRATLADVVDRAFIGGKRASSAHLILDVARKQTELEPGPVTQEAPAILCSGTYTQGILHLGAQVAEALESVHRVGLCHRDLKPSNVLISADGTPRLLDFNLSSDANQELWAVGGTLPYMAPETFQDMGPSNPAVVGPAADLYGLGVMLYEALTGRQPFGPITSTEATKEICLDILDRQLRGTLPVRHFAPDVPVPIAALIDGCLKFNPEDRPESAGILAKVIREHLRPASQPTKSSSRHRRLLFGLAASLCALSLGAAAQLGFRDHHIDPSSELRKGVGAFQAARFDEAIAHFTAGLEADRDIENGHLFRGRARMAAALELRAQRELVPLADRRNLEQNMREHFQGAFEDFFKVHSATRGSPAGQLQAAMALCLIYLRHHSDAAQSGLEAMNGGFETPEVLNNRGYSLSMQNDSLEAEKAFDKALALGPRLVAAYFNRANLTHRSTAARLADIEKAIELDPEVPDFHLMAATLCMETLRVTASLSRVASLLQRLPATPVEEAISATLKQKALGHLSRAVELGCDPARLREDVHFKPLAGLPVFDVLCQSGQRPHSGHVVLKAVDPLRGEPLVVD